MKRLVFRLVLLACGVAFVEGGSFVLLRSSPELRDRISLGAAGLDSGERGRAHARIGQALRGGGFMEEAIHPYLGFAVVPRRNVEQGPLSLDSLGFPNGGPLLRERSPDAVVMGIFGGSVAAYFSQGGGPERIFEGLRALPEFAGKRLVPLSAAHLGYKQPQSLIALAYLQSLGVNFDLVILLDGFNEVVNAPLELAPAGVFPFFPSRWQLRVANLDVDTEMRSRIGEIAYRKEQRAQLAAAVRDSRWGRSRTVELLWALCDRHLEGVIEARRAELDTLRLPQQRDYAATGPPAPWRDPETLSGELASFWMRSSLQMRALAEAGGGRFFHFLQPNQHLPGTKPMDAEEAAVAIEGGDAFAPHVARGYPLLQERGQELRAQGVRFHDLTRVFAGTREPVYVDNIGHVGARGNEILADAIANEIRSDLSERAR